MEWLGDGFKKEICNNELESVDYIYLRGVNDNEAALLRHLGYDTLDTNGEQDVETWVKYSQNESNISDADIQQLIIRYENAKMESKRLQAVGNPECRFEFGRALALEAVLRILGFDYTEVSKEHWIGEEMEGK